MIKPHDLKVWTKETCFYCDEPVKETDFFCKIVATLQVNLNQTRKEN